MHVLQQKILDLSHTVNLGELTLRDIGTRVGDDKFPQKIKHHLDQLYKKGYLKKNPDGSVVSRADHRSSDLFYTIPVVGAANCGQAVTFAEENVDGYLTLSKSLLRRFNENMFAVRAIGNSMNKANVEGESINDGDYVIIDPAQRPLQSYFGQYVLSVIDGMANIKKLSSYAEKELYVLTSESSEEYPPIYIHHDDFRDYLINGTVAKVVKRRSQVS